MFKLFAIDNQNNEKEILPEKNGVYIVYELFHYKFTFNQIIKNQLIYLEDEIFDPKNEIINFTNKGVSCNRKKRIFEDLFGYVTLKFDQIKFNFEVRIEKVKVPELEKILLYLWNQNSIVFDNFFSKSTLKSKLATEINDFNYSSKFVNIFEEYYSFFKNKFYNFKSLPHSVIRSQNIVSDYETADISNNSIDWLIHNLDELNIDYSYKNIENSIQIKNSYGIVEKILTEEKINDFNTYENQIILGSFDFVLIEIMKIKNTIKQQVSTNHYYEKDYFSINQFKVIPFLRLRDDLEKIESKLNLLKNRYKIIFVNTKHKNSFPKLTSVFANKRHYTEAYQKIKQIRNININLDGEFSLLNLKKISKLYEIYNTYVLINSFKEHKPITTNLENKTEDNISQEIYFEFQNFKISLFYDISIGNQKNKIGLQRIKPAKKSYKPDHIIKLEKNNETKFYILDSKYSTEPRIKSSHLPECINKYILDIGITDSPSKKIEELILIYPGENEKTIYGNDFFKPKIGIIPSKVGLNNVQEFINRILN
ncbi:hypothetical protein [Aureivirga marina]|uniref:hypothetical protein n=1 Tax=Aureivirga marina TaxID=1182451 RepID=UPI0018C8EDAB|nr:hypothetical protein [Aureivirga marina]